MKSSIRGLNLVTSIFNPIITMAISNAVKQTLKDTLPQVLTDTLQSEFEIPFMGIFHSEFLGPPDISPDGMMVEMDIVPGKRPVHPTTVKLSNKKEEIQAVTINQDDDDKFPPLNLFDFLDD